MDLMPETDRWVKETLMAQVQAQTTIINKLESGERRMERIETSLGSVAEATQQFQPMKLDVAQLKKAEELRTKEEQLKLKQELEEMKAKKAEWGKRFWELFVKASPFIFFSILFLYSQIKDQL